MAQIVLVTGSSSGFGRLIVETLARQGYTVFAGMRAVAGKNAYAAEELLSFIRFPGSRTGLVEVACCRLNLHQSPACGSRLAAGSEERSGPFLHDNASRLDDRAKRIYRRNMFPGTPFQQHQIGVLAWFNSPEQQV